MHRAPLHKMNEISQHFSLLRMAINIWMMRRACYSITNMPLEAIATAVDEEHTMVQHF